MLVRFLKNYALRHQHPANQFFHLIGLPVTFILPVVLAMKNHPWWAVASFVGGYCLQFVGHACEGNDAGEVILVKKALGLPYTAIVDRSKASSGAD
jgi:uncharacterized membrane protein YGL010W